VPVTNEKRPRFTDVYQINNEEEDKDDSNADYILADNEDLYYQVYSEYVRNSFNSPSLPQIPKRGIKSNFVNRRRGKREVELKAIVEEDSVQSENSSAERSSLERIVSPNKRIMPGSYLSPQFDNYIVEDSQNKNISKMRKEIFQLSQYIATNEKIERSQEMLILVC